MRLAVLGSMPTAMISAAWASATSGQEVAYVTDTASGTWSGHVLWGERSEPAQVEHVKVGAPLEADAFLLIASRKETLELVRLYKQAMKGRPVLLAPGGFAVVEAVAEQLAAGAPVHSALGQLPGFPVTGSMQGDTIQIRSVKRDFPVGALRGTDLPNLLRLFRSWFPDLTESTLAETTLANTNNVIHPPILLINAARTELADQYLLYRQGMSPGAARLIGRIDRERLDLLATLNQDTTPITGWFERYYGDQGLTGDTIEEMLTTLPALSSSRGPETLEHRFIFEDVAGGLAPMEELARRRGVETPYLSSLITTLSAIFGTDLRAQAPDLVDRLAFG
jgi:opine dehydrogenase